jgi:hypothetical protein
MKNCISITGSVNPRAIVQLEGLGSTERSSNLSGNRTRDIAACSVVPQSTMLTLASSFHLYFCSKRSSPLTYLYTYISGQENKTVSETISLNSIDDNDNKFYRIVLSPVMWRGQRAKENGAINISYYYVI